MRCPNCNAANPDGAAWCNQCLTKFEAPPVPPELRVIPGDLGPGPAGEPARAERSAGPWGSRALAPVPDPSPAPETAEEALPDWTCRSCGSSNPMAENVCAVCGRTIYETYGGGGSASSGEQRNPSIAAGLSIVPGAGHIYLKRTAEGVVRILLFLWWTGTAVFLRGGPVGFLRITFAAAAAGLVGVSTADAYRSAADPKARSLLPPKAIFYVSLGLMGALFIGLIMAFSASTRAVR